VSKPLTSEEFQEHHGAGSKAKATERSRRHEDLVTAVIGWLKLQIVNGQRVVAFRVDTGRHLAKRPGGPWEVGKAFGTKGAPDISGIIPGVGRRLDIDVKIGPDQLSDDQAAFFHEVRSRGGIALEVRDCLDSLIQQFPAAIQEARP